MTISLAFVPAIAGCGGARQASTPTLAAAAPVNATHMMPNGAQMTTAEMDTAWASRPAFVRQNQRTEMAYAYAVRSGHVIDWMPCYCGCEAMGHGSNLDCYFKPMPATSTKVVYDEHASYCDICVDIALTAKRLISEGASMRAVRDAVDRQYGKAGPGTDTALPPS